MFGTVQDVTERKNAEEILEKYRLFSENAHDIVLFIRRDGRILEANAAAVKAYGYAYEELLSLSIYDLRALDIGYHIDEQMDMAYNNGILFEAVHRRKDGSDFPVEVSSQGRTINGQRVLLSVVRDITERKRVEEALRESESNLKRAEEIAMIGNWNWDLVTNRISWSEETYVVWGFKPGEIQPSFDLVVTNVHPDDREFFVRSVNASLYEHHPLSMDFRIIRPDGSLAYVHNEAEILYGPDGKPVRMFGTAQDITERKLIEEALQVAKAQAELYVDLMGHDINNMNMVAMGTLEIALMDMEQDGKLDSSSKPLLDKSIESLKNSSALIRNVQKLQRASVEGIKLQAVDVADILKGIIDEQRSTPGKDVTIYYKNEASHCLVTANELLRDVFTNIISNSIKHARTDRHLTIGVTVENIVEDGRKFCRVAIDDNGSGIPDEVKDRLFRRFSRGETKARGSGLGLYLVRTLVEHYGGQIRVEDRVPGDYTRGAKFVVMIPSVE